MSNIRTILLVAAAIVVALLAWAILQFLTAIVIKIISFAIFLAIVYAVFLFARSTIRRRNAPQA